MSFKMLVLLGKTACTWNRLSGRVSIHQPIRNVVDFGYPFSGIESDSLNGRGWTAKVMVRVARRDRQRQRNEQRPTRGGAAGGRFQQRSAYVGQTGCPPRT